MKSSRSIAFAALFCAPVVGLSGCMTSLTAVKRAKGEYLWPQPRNSKKPKLEPKPVYYAMLPLTVPFDVATAPIQFPLFMMWMTMTEQERQEQQQAEGKPER